MQKRKIWESFLQWVLPGVLLVIALVLSIYDFNNKMDTAIQTVVDDQAEQIGLYYAAGVEDKLKAVGNITDAVLSVTLKELIADDIVIRKSYDEIPPRVEYSLTDKGSSVVPILQTICQWSGAYHKEDSENTMIQCQKCDYRS